MLLSTVLCLLVALIIAGCCCCSSSSVLISLLFSLTLLLKRLLEIIHLWCHTVVALESTTIHQETEDFFGGVFNMHFFFLTSWCLKLLPTAAFVKMSLPPSFDLRRQLAPPSSQGTHLAARPTLRINCTTVTTWTNSQAPPSAAWLGECQHNNCRSTAPRWTSVCRRSWMTWQQVSVRPRWFLNSTRVTVARKERGKKKSWLLHVCERALNWRKKKIK